MGRFDGRVAWVTGGGSGIGLACAVELARQGARVVVSGRRLDRLQEALAAIEAAGGRGVAVACDVTDEASTVAAVAEIVGQAGRLDVVLAGAGFSVKGRIVDMTDAEWRRQIDTNVFGVLNTVRAAWPELKKSRGRIALVGSVAAFLPSPKYGAYGASKAMVRSIGETLSLEAAQDGVSCTTIHPGYVESEIAKVDNDGRFDPERQDRRPARLMWKADDAAVVMVDGIYRRQRELVFTGHGRLAVALARHFPGLVSWAAGRV